MSNPSEKTIQIDSSELPLSCPTHHTSVWNLHPKVFLQVDEHGHASCPYCGTQYHVHGDIHAH